MQTYRDYKGWDWSELCKALNIPHYHDDIELYKKGLTDPVYAESYWLEQYLLTVCGHGHTSLKGRFYVFRRTAHEVRAYLNELAKDEMHDTAIWKGMLNIESDLVLLQYFSAVCGMAWS